MAWTILAACLAASVWAQGAPTAPSRQAQGAEAAPKEDASTCIEQLASPETRDTARDKLRDLGPAAVPALLDALKHAEPVVRSESAFVLGRIGRKEAVPALIDALNDADALVRANAAYALGEIADVRALEPLMRRLSDADAGVRANACFALGHVGDPRAAPELVKALVDPDENVRNFAASALGATNETTALPALAWVALRDASGGVRALAATSLGALKDKRACATLVGLLEDKEYVVRAQAVEALLALTRERRGYDARDSDKTRADAVARWKTWLAKQKFAALEPRAPMEVYASWPGRPKAETPAEPPPDAADLGLVPTLPEPRLPVMSVTPSEASVENMRAIVARDPKNAAAWTTLGAMLDALGKPDDAERAYRQALDGFGDANLARWNLAELLMRAGKVAEPRRLYEALDKLPALPAGLDRALVKVRLATCLRRFGETDAAVAMLDAVARGSDDPATLRAAAREFAAMKRYNRTEGLLTAEFKRTQGGAESAYALAAFLLRVPDAALRDLAKASVYAEMAITAKPNEERFVSVVAEAAWACGEKAKAVEILERALKTRESEPLKKQLEDYRKLLAPADKKDESPKVDAAGETPEGP